MTNNDNTVDRRSELPHSDQAGYGKDEEQVAHALGTLRLLINKEDPLSLREAIALARRLAETYAHWQQSDAPIKDLVVRLSDGQEIAVDQSNIASLCGLHFRNAFRSDAVLHIWKKADEHYGEVQLLSLSLKDVRANGYKYEKTYQNGQTLSLKVERCSDGQFYISVDCTAKEHARAATPKSYSWLPIFVPAAIALAKLGSFLRNMRLVEPAWALSRVLLFTLLMGLVCSVVVNGFLLRLDLNKLESPEPMKISFEDRKAERLADVLKLEVEKNIRDVLRSLVKEVGENKLQSTDVGSRAILNRTKLLGKVPVNSTAVRPLVGVFDRVEEPGQVHTSDVVDKSDKRDESGGRRKSDKVNESPKTIGRNPTGSKKVDEVVADVRTAIRIETSSNLNAALGEALRKAFVSALEQSHQFVVLKENKSSRGEGCLVNVRFAPKKDCHGIILAELYDNEGNLLWHGNRNCYDFPEGELFEDAPQQLVGEMVSSLEASKALGDRTE